VSGRARIARWSRWSRVALVAGASGALAAVALTLRWRGSDVAAQVYRVEVLCRYGLVVWDSQWFSGYPTFGCSVLSPALGAAAGPLFLGAISGVVPAVLFDRIVQRAVSPTSRVGMLWFALGTVTNLVVGRITFAFGVAVAFGGDIYALQRHRTMVGCSCG